MNYNLYKGNDSNELIVFYGGTGDTKEIFHDLATELSQKHNLSCCAWDYSKEYRHDADVDGEAIIQDVRNLFQELEEEGYDDFTSWGTSLGAVPAVFSAVYTDANISTLILMDPADYYTDPIEFKKHPETWNGGEKYEPTSKTVSNLLANMEGKTKVNVVHFGLRNCRDKGYIDENYEDRWKDYEYGIPRLSYDMAKSFYDCTPERHRGEFIEDKQLPHGIFNYGDVKKNQERLVELTLEFINTNN